MRFDIGVGDMLFNALMITGLYNGFLGVAFANPVLPRDTSTSMTSTGTSIASTASTSTSSTVSTPSTLLSTTTAPATVQTAGAATAPSGTTDDLSDLVTTSVISATSTAIVTNALNSATECHSGEMGDFPPFCEPLNGSTKWVGASYYVTWDVTEFTQNTTITIVLDYINATGAAPQNAWSSAKTAKNLGYVIMTMDAAWLQGQSFNNLSLTLVSFDPTVNEAAKNIKGPTIGLINQPAQHYPPPPHAELNKLGLEVGIPVGVGAFMFIICGLWFGMRKTRRIELGNIMGRRKGYGVGKSRRQRLGKQTDIQLRESALRPTSPEFRDEPLQGVESSQRFAGHARDESLGSLVSSVAGDSFSRPQGNVFREELERQRTGH